VVLLVLLVQLVLAGFFVLDWKIAAAAIFGGVLFFAVMERPVVGVALLLMARLMDTATNAFLRIGHTNIGSFELFLLLALVAMAVHVARRKQPILVRWPWQPALLAFMAFQVITLAWSANRGEGISEIISMGVVVANCALIVAFVRTPRQFLLVVYAWILACVLISSYSFITDLLGSANTGPWKAAEGGGRETGLGQQPNWYAMNLSFIIHTTFGLAIVQRRRLMRYLFVAAGLFIFLAMMRSGSRGATYSIIIGGGLVALALPLFRKWFFRFVVTVLLIFGGALSLDLGSTSQALGRIYDNLDRTWSGYRIQNWAVCFQMFRDTWGRGVGAGGYITLLPDYNYFIYQSDYRYPHGIFQGLVAHYGVVGLAVLGWLAVVVFRMARQVSAWTRDTLLEIFAWTMPASMLGYLAWSLVEFEYNEKPFWEFLALFTALFLMVRRARSEGEPLPAMPAEPDVPWRRARAMLAKERQDQPEASTDLHPPKGPDPQ